MNTTVTLDVIQTLVYAGVAIGGYFLSHSGILKKLGGNGSPNPAPTPTPAPIISQPAMANILKVFEDQLLQILSDAVKRMVQPGQQPAGAATTPVAGQGKQS